jgi:histone acetyltransferase (RNA polymerase elongator complex component)
VIKGTTLAEWYRQGLYQPLGLEEAVSLATGAMKQLLCHGIQVIRVGLQPTEDIAPGAELMAGPFHPAFRQLVDGRVALDAMHQAIGFHHHTKDKLTVSVNPRQESIFRGQKNVNRDALKEQCNLAQVDFKCDIGLAEGTFRLESDPISEITYSIHQILCKMA